MPRKGPVPKRDVLPDPIYNSKLVTKFINYLMLDGKKGVAQSIFYEAMEIIREKTGNEPLEVFENAVKNVSPVLEVKARRIGGANYRCRLKFHRIAEIFLLYVGWCNMHAPVAKGQWPSVWLRKF